ncbi:hemagglutinin repeat-containing protein [Escherichia coli]|uniref:hemagglutinin repeat-containing protein n=1 Tax=Escherichia coli TaxID=562 RepID=UPI00200F3FE2|nr:hemagglutinin repeat-containing protein [Escherichia coli]MCL0910241.1 hemagglutinin repeat-containing protein [Escherichia coli]
MARQYFKLSSAGRLASIIAISFVTCSSFAAGIVADGGALGPGVSTAANGTQVVNIVKPTDQGLSHNQYQDFNVNRPGAVFNNALSAGQSQLAGQLAANPNLNGHSASVILNEVISRNPSLLLGQQEVFGMAADYVLANPNGITCDGCGFINTSRSSLVVGNPLIENGMLRAYSTLNNHNLLQIGSGGVAAEHVLDLVAPRIESNGAVRAVAINAISGNNRLTRDLTQIESAPNDTALDSYYLGSMQAGRIRIINTAEGSGVKLAGSLQAEQAIKVKAKDRLALQSAQLRGGDVTLQAKTLRAEGTLTERATQSSGKDNYQNYRGGIDVHASQQKQRYRRTEISGKNLTLVAAESNHLTATDLRGDDVTIQGGDVLLDGQLLTQRQEQTDNRWFYSWQHDETRHNSQQQVQTGRIEARHNANLSATRGDLRLEGSEVKAGQDIRLRSQGDITLRGVREHDESQLTGYKRNEGASLNSGRWQQRQSEERLRQVSLRAGHDAVLQAKGNLNAQAAQIQSNNDAEIAAAGTVTLDVQNVANRKSEVDNHTYWGGIGGGGERDNNHSQERSHASEVESGGTLTISGGQGVTIRGSRAQGGRGGVVQARQGNVVIDHVVNTSSEQDNSRRGGVFNITTASQQRKESHEQLRASQLTSDVNLRVQSAGDIQVLGSQVAGDGHVDLNAGGRVDVKAAARVDSRDEQSTSLHARTYAKKQGDKQYRVGLGLEHTVQQETSQSVTHRGSQIQGASVALTAGDDVQFTGSRLQANAGDVQISGKNVAFVSAEDSQANRSQKQTAGGGLYFTAGIDKVGSGFEGDYSTSDSQHNQTRARGSSSEIKGNLIINAQDTLTQQGASHQVGGAYRAQAAKVAQLEAHDRDSSRSQGTRVDAEVGVNVNYSAVLRPLARAAQKAASLDVNGAIDELGKVGKPNLGLDIGANGGTQTESRSESRAKTTHIQAGTIEVTARDTIHDRGTQYRANMGGVTLQADNHRFEAASDSSQSSAAQGGATLRVYTTTGKDIGVTISGQGENRRREEQRSQAQSGSIQAQSGIDIRLGQTGNYQGTTLDGGQGKTQIHSAGDLHIVQATDSHSTRHQGFDAHARVSGDMNSGSAALGGGQNNGQQSNSQAHAASIRSAGGVTLESGGMLTLQGAQVDSQGEVTLRAADRLDLRQANAQRQQESCVWSGELSGGGGRSSGDSESWNGSLGAKAGVTMQHEQQSTAQGGQISGASVTLSAGSEARDALHLQGTQVKGKAVTLSAQQGGIMLESAKDSQVKNNWGFEASGSLSVSQSMPLNIGLKVNVDQQDQTKQHNTQILAEQVNLSSHDVRM